ncbi:MAG: endonuclease/exonuclease/phosphatase family protein [Clostridia bacterium]|nr:endonuclease/exonuclease/phosphatase family protein [Clostridia bacterium]
MTAKKWMAIAMIFALLLTGMVGCKSPDTEEGAVVNEYVEGDTSATDVEQDLPEKVEQSETGSSANDTDELADNSGDTTKTETPKEDTPALDTQTLTEDTNTPAEEDPVEEPEVQYQAGNLLKLVDYNVRCANDGDNKQVADRGPRLEKLIDQLDPDLMGFQEVTPTWRGLLAGYFSDEYDYVYKERNPGGECTPIFWKKDKFEKMDEGYFWLSETPESESKGWDADYYRICSWVRLKIKATGKEFLYFNSHWDGSGQCHIGSAKVTFSYARKAGAFSKYGMLLTADFNMIPWSKGYSAVVESGELSDVNYDLENDTTPTTNGYNDSSGGRIIDMCFYSPEKILPVSYKVLNEKIDGGYISDHRGLLVEVAIL